MKKSKTILLTGLIMIFTAGPAFSITVDEAYRAIPHQRTAFDAGTASMSDEEKRFLSIFFELVDMGVVTKVESMNLDPSAVRAKYAVLKTQFDSIETPSKLKNVRKLVAEAIEAQETYLSMKPRPEMVSNQQVQKASQKLRAAYGELLNLYPLEKERNKQAFFDYLCALDFV